MARSPEPTTRGAITVQFDVIIRGGTVHDGAGSPPIVVDIGINGGRIEAVGDLSRATCPAFVDASGLAVAPGFIDAHAHSDLVALLPETDSDVATATVRQGVTTEVTGNCGFSTFPSTDERRADLQKHVGALVRAPITWSDLAGYKVAVENAGTYTNIAPLVGHGSLRAGLIGMGSRPLRDDEIQAMTRATDTAFEQGAFGISSGLIYAPGVYAGTDELVTLSRVANRHGRPYTTHMRNETDRLKAAVDEAITIGRQAEVPVQISHHKAVGRSNWGLTHETLKMIEQARVEGVDVTLDVYPYTAASTMLHAMLPPWVHEGGRGAMRERLGEGEVRDRIDRDMRSGLPGWENLSAAVGWDSVVVASYGERPEYEGQTIAAIADDRGQGPLDAALDLLQSQPEVLVVLHGMNEVDVDEVLAYKWSMIGSDGIPVPGKPHPRLAGTFSRVLGRYTRERQVLDLPTAIQKMTSMTANRFGIRDRGSIARGKAADIVIFDPTAVLDLATFESPLLHPAGIGHVFVNGQAVVSNGRLTGARPGVVLEPN